MYVWEQRDRVTVVTVLHKRPFIFNEIWLEISKHSVNNVAERAEVDEEDDTEDNSSFGVESVLMIAAWP